MSLAIIVSTYVAPVVKRVGFGSTNRPEERTNAILKQLLHGQPTNKGKSFFSKNPLANAEMVLDNTHCKDYVSFVTCAWTSLMDSTDAAWADSSQSLVPNHVLHTKPGKHVPMYKRAGYYIHDTMTPFNEYTAETAFASASVCYEAAAYAIAMDDQNELKNYPVYALVASPGHHAKYDSAAGYCVYANAVIAARRLQEFGCKRVLILDLDFHAGNGTSNIVATHPGIENIFAASLHADPAIDYPSFEGYVQDNITGKVYNEIIPPQANWQVYAEHLKRAIAVVKASGPTDALVVAFGGDTYKDDPDALPLARMSLELDDYSLMGQTVAEAFPNIPTVVTQEGGYCIEAIGSIVDNFLQGFVQ